MNKLVDTTRVFVSPIVASTGINTKNVYAFIRGIPLVTLPSGSKGLCKRCDDVLVRIPIDPFEDKESYKSSINELPLAIGRNAHEFINKIKEFYFDQKLWSL